MAWMWEVAFAARTFIDLGGVWAVASASGVRICARRAVGRAVGRHDQLVAGAEVAFCAALRAKLPDGQERVLKRWCASHVAQEQGARVAVHVGGEQVEFADGCALPRFLVDAHDVFVAWLGVD
eukprot:4992218-Pleurochrysis_carterae.AAC.1